jgi:hypothetical protein
MTPERLLLLHHAIATHGIAAHEHEVARHLADLRAAGCTDGCLDIAADRTQPAVARERAFGRLPLFARRTPAATTLDCRAA